jgi:hypothetical protein
VWGGSEQDEQKERKNKVAKPCQFQKGDSKRILRKIRNHKLYVLEAVGAGIRHI